MPKLSICVPVHDMENGDYFFKRLEQSLSIQKFIDFELIVTAQGKMAENTNAAIKKARGDIIKILYMDDYLAHSNSLKNIVDNFTGGWLASGCIHTYDGKHLLNQHFPSYNKDIARGNNTIGSPSVLAFENNDPLLFDENLSWLLDCDLYQRLYEKYGQPTLLNSIDVVIGLGQHQTTHKLSDLEKDDEFKYMTKKYV